MIRYIVENITTQEFETEVYDKNKTINLRVNIFVPQANRDKFDVVWMGLNDITQTVIDRKKLKESEEKYRLIFENEDDAILISDLETRQFFDVNPAAEQMYGYDREEFLKLSVNSLTLEPEKTSEVLSRMAEEKIVKVPYRLNRKKDGSIIVVEFKSSSFIYKNKKLLVTIARDITEKHRTEQILKESEEQYRKLVTNLPVGIFWVDQDGFILFSHVDIEGSGIKSEDIINTQIFPLALPEYRKKLKEILNQTFTKGIVKRVEVESIYNNWADVRFIPIIQDGETVEVLIIYDLITTRKKAELKLRESEFKYQSLISNIPSVAWVSDESGQTTFISQNVQRVYGYTPKEIIDSGEKLWLGRIHPDDLERVKTHYQLLFKNQGEFNVEYRIQKKNKEWIWLHDKVSSLKKKDEKIVAYGVFTDVTELKKNREVLFEKEKKYRSLFEQTPMAQSERDYSDVKTHLINLRSNGIEDLRGYFETNPEEVFNIAKKVKLIDVNQSALDLYKVATKEEFASLAYDYLTDHPQTMDSFINLLIAIDQNKTSHSFFSKIKVDDEKMKVINVILLVPEGFENSYERVWSKYIDITELKEAENTLIENEMKYKTIFDLTEDAIVIFDREIIIDCNKASVRLFGFKDKTELVGLRLIDFSPKFQPDGQSSFTKFVEKIGSVYFGDQEIFLWRTKRIDSQKEFDSEVKLTKLRIGNKEMILGVIRPYDFKY
jgi:PAS domain S-box-containing protein